MASVSKLALLLTSGNQDGDLLLQQRIEEGIEDIKKKKNKVVDQTYAMKDNPKQAKPIDEASQVSRKDSKKRNNVQNDIKNLAMISIMKKNPKNHRVAKPVGNIVKVSKNGNEKGKHFESFELDGVQYDIEDTVLIVSNAKVPDVAIIKNIIQKRIKDQEIMIVKVHWFYRPEDTKKKCGGHWESSETRELYYSFHPGMICPNKVIKKCTVHFIPSNKKIPHQKQYPGFIVQKVYDDPQKRPFKFTDNVYVKKEKDEIHLLIQKTMSRVGELPNIDHNDQLKQKRTLMKKNYNAYTFPKHEFTKGFRRSMK